MEMNRGIKRALVASVAAGALFATALPANAETGVSKSEIKLGITLPMTGAASPGYNKLPGAMQAYFDYVNANGGVNGRNVKLIVKDDGYLPTLAVAKTNELILKDKVFAIVGALGTANNKAVARSVDLGRRGVPSLFINTGFSGFADRAKYPTTYPLFPSYIMEAKVMGKYLKDNFAGKKLGLIYQDDDFGADAQAGFAAAGVKFDVSIPYASGSQSATTAAGWVGKLKAAGAEVVVVFGVTSATGATLAASAALAYKPQWILGSVGGDATTLKALGVPAAILTGAQGASFLPSPGDANDEYVKQFTEIYKAAVPDGVFDNNVLVGMNTAMMTVQALRAAGKNPTRKSLMNAIGTKAFSWSSASLSPILYTKTSHIGYNSYWFGTYNTSGVMLPAGGKYTLYSTDSGSGAVTKSSYTRPDMPAKGLPTNS